jgi:acetylornithine/N-succinyldiaminopimelate aminotransferase
MAAQPLLDAARHLYPNYKQPSPVFVRGEGSRLWDSEGRVYLDLFAGVAVSVLGHAHPGLTHAIAEQAKTLIHVSNHFYNEANLRLAAELCRQSGYDRALFVNSGTEAIEACVKLVRRHFFARGEVGRTRLIACENSFHGRTLGALSLTGQASYREGFGPLGPVTHVPYGDLNAIEGALGPDVAGIFVEPIQGEGGVIPAPPGYLQGLRQLCDRTGTLLVLDEIQTGIGRTGTFLAQAHDGVRGDVIALAKALGGGVPIGAMLCKEEFSGALPPGTHGTTYGGNPLASAAALAVLKALEEEQLTSRAATLGSRLADKLQTLASRHPNHVAGARGRGLLQAIVLTSSVDRAAFLVRLREEGLLLIPGGATAVRIAPPLNIPEADLDAAISTIDRVLGELS